LAGHGAAAASLLCLQFTGSQSQEKYVKTDNIFYFSERKAPGLWQRIGAFCAAFSALSCRCGQGWRWHCYFLKQNDVAVRKDSYLPPCGTDGVYCCAVR
jgi:hypothetical protein